MSSNTSVWAVVPAAGIGSRMQADIPKQYLSIADKTILQLTLERLSQHPRIKGIVVALADDDRWWSQLELDLDCELLTARGGENRSDSVSNALKVLRLHTETESQYPLVLVHDAARPCLRLEDIDHMLVKLSDHETGGILGVPVTDTVKRVDDMGSIQQTINREGLWRAATPQMFPLLKLQHALSYCVANNILVTDEASAIEAIGEHPQMIEGHSDNIKITLPQDLALAALFLRQQEEKNQ
ncbi:MAG TPA: 2-C-methyl-D-erythritol 4-phosphate cytidylyltransferase [Methylophaga aminisulfidivorans]|uniref:2-C-methyl-D-erythritol 4-phosphate cytidylyltransferase n=2 Tax=root TaxID=1 RepID=A0A7C1ZNW3_9GAMM|nr:2-C-methyl-D-erythritol 4-phosphate cytidylyltransferase [Methylophaga aminisulfidivorans]HEC73303.1 2-C-methyl-D-erythritol 4-phosphate cytidylyltransferase [Methylophaga aminisulfidivorans]